MLKQRRRLGRLYNVASGDKLTRRWRPDVEAAINKPKFAVTVPIPGMISSSTPLEELMLGTWKWVQMPSCNVEFRKGGKCRALNGPGDGSWVIQGNDIHIKWDHFGVYVMKLDATGVKLNGTNSEGFAVTAVKEKKTAKTTNLTGTSQQKIPDGTAFMGTGGGFERATSPVTFDLRPITAPGDSRPVTALTTFDMDTESRARSRYGQIRTAGEHSMSSKLTSTKEHSDIPGKPWYYGYNNTVGVPPSSPFANIPRYGARGLLGLAQHVGVNRPVEEQLLVDEWTPPLRAGPATHNVSYTSPKAWPDNACYTKGPKIDAKNIPYWYKSQTTSTEENRPECAQSLHLEKLVVMDKAITMRLKEATRQERVAATVDASLRATVKPKKKNMRTDLLGRDIKKIKEKGEHREMKYFGSLTAYVNTGGGTGASDKQSKKQILQQNIKWSLLKNLARATRAQRNSSQGLIDLGAGFAQHSESNAMPSTITRDQFVSALIRLKHFGFSESEANHLYACFDVNHTNRIAWVEILMGVRLVLGSTHEDTVTILQGMFEIMEHFSFTAITAQNLHNLFLTCCSNEAQQQTILTFYRQRFKFEMERILREHAATIKTEGDKLVFGQITLPLFTEALERCPLLVEEFEEQMKERLAACTSKKGKKKD